MIVVLSLASARAQQPGAAEAPGADAVRQGCGSVVLVHCAPPEKNAGVPVQAADAPKAPTVDEREATRRKLDARRLRQPLAQIGDNSIVVTAERSTEDDPYSWESFRQSMSDAAIPDCLSQEALPSAQGLLRAPVLLGAAAVDKCR